MYINAHYFLFLSLLLDHAVDKVTYVASVTITTIASVTTDTKVEDHAGSAVANVVSTVFFN